MRHLRFLLKGKQGAARAVFFERKKSVPHVQFSSKQKKHAARAVFFERKNVRHVLYLLKGKKARAIDSCTFLISLVGR